MLRRRLGEIRDTHHAGLLNTAEFWLRHAVDREHGGCLYHLDRDGSVYGTDKPVWLLGRTVWTYATLYRRVEQRPAWLEVARRTHDFLVRHCFDLHGKMYFLVTRDGRPLRMRRYAYSEVFGVLGCAALAQATGAASFAQQAAGIFERFVRHLRGTEGGPPKIDPQVRPMKGLAPLMCLLVMADALVALAQAAGNSAAPPPAAGPVPSAPLQPPAYYEAHLDAAIEEIFRDFVKPAQRVVLETVGPDGEFIDEPDGRVMNPGHVIECAWFMHEIARRRDDRALVERALPLIDWPMERGWDPQYGGLLYFVDASGQPATQLEHDMKLWWPHCEALYATLLAYHLTGRETYAQMYSQLHDWTLAHFPDPEFGEWFGYLHRDGTVSTPIKGGTWKGPFHVPRAQLLCWKLAAEMAG